MTQVASMRKLLVARSLRLHSIERPIASVFTSKHHVKPSPGCPSTCRCFAQVKDIAIVDCQVYFTSSAPWKSIIPPDCDKKPVDERTLQLGKTVRELHERLPTLLQTPLPLEILSPQIKLHLFPSTHPHLPTVSGKIAYAAALWTAPVAWGKVPLVGNVKLDILSERMVRHGGSMTDANCRDEKLIVKWKTRGKGSHRDTTGGVYRDQSISERDPVDKIKAFLGRTIVQSDADVDRDEEFCGIFIFEFDEQGRLAKHTIEHTDQGGRYDKMNRVVNVTDWLLGKFSTKREETPALAFCSMQQRHHRTRIPR